jgi:hypothetical protein
MRFHRTPIAAAAGLVAVVLVAMPHCSQAEEMPISRLPARSEANSYVGSALEQLMFAIGLRLQGAHSSDLSTEAAVARHLRPQPLPRGMAVTEIPQPVDGATVPVIAVPLDTLRHLSDTPAVVAPPPTAAHGGTP